MVNIQVLLLVFSIIISNNIVFLQPPLPPNILISFPDVGDVDYQNESMAIMSNANPLFEMLCTADYPVEWIFHYSPEDDGTSEDTKLANTYRLTDKFLDKSSYKYSAKLRLGYKGKLLSLTNFTCREAGLSPSQAEDSNNVLGETNVIMVEENQKSLIILKITGEKLHDSSTFNNKTNENCGRAVAEMAQPEGELVPCWRCENPENGKRLELDFVDCITPIQCGSTYRRQNKGTECLRRMDDLPEDCRRVNPDYNSKIVLCKNFGPTLAQFYFFGVFRGEIEDESIPEPPLYFNWDEVDPVQMLFIHPINRSIIYQDEEVIFTCEYSRYYFSLGSWFGIESESGIEYIKAIDQKPCDTDPERTEMSINNCTVEESWRGTYRATLNTDFHTLGSHQVFCFGPVWNSTEWINTSVAFTVEEGEPPNVLSVEADNNNEDFIVGQQHRRLVCKFSGTPVPTVSWSGPGNTTQYTGFYASDYVNELQFSEIGYQTAGKYTCSVTSYLGSHSRSFVLNSHGEHQPGLSTTSIILISLAVCAVCCFILLLLLRMGRIITAQREALRVLTEAEIEEFLTGNPEMLEEGRKIEHFSRALAIESLPYDKKYEILVDNIFIDHTKILGSGQFGIVFKGKVSPEIALHYVNVSRQSYVTLPETIEVAIKICKGNLDVVSFKAILTEIKVMAYLGTHDKIVSLIGACTQNIRNREIYVAVEYCHNGSLEIYMRKNKGDFINDLTETRDGLTLRKLYEWTIDIAEGLEYIHGKRIVHADIASRNILLTLNLRAKVGDFGLSRALLESSSYTKTTKCPLPWRNMAIESLKNLEFSVKSDMWAFGVTLWELFTLGDVPYPGITYSFDFVNLLERGLRLYKPPHACNDIYDYMLMCWNNVPSDRPATSDLKIICFKTLQQT